MWLGRNEMEDLTSGGGGLPENISFHCNWRTDGFCQVGVEVGNRSHCAQLSAHVQKSVIVINTVLIIIENIQYLPNQEIIE